MSDATARADATAIDLVGIGRWLRSHVDQDVGDIVEGRLIGGGSSNLTYAVSDGTRSWVVRRPPVGAFLPTAHDMSREHRFYDALGPTDVPTPRVYGQCEDASFIGAPFYVMELMDGVVFDKPSNVEPFSVDARERAADEFVDVLRRIHAVDFRAVGLGDIARVGGYLERQVKRWADQWERSKSGDLPEMDELFRRLANALPKDSETTIVHGDYRLGNVMYERDGRMCAVFDWEMATLGDPLADVGYTLLYWGGGPEKLPVHESQLIADMDGFFDADELVERYARATGRAVDNVDFYVVLAHVKLSIIGQGGMARRLRATGEDPSKHGVPASFRARTEWILDLASRSSMPALRS